MGTGCGDQLASSLWGASQAERAEHQECRIMKGSPLKGPLSDDGPGKTWQKT